MTMQLEPPLMERLLNMAPIGILLLDAAGRISSVNSTLLQFLNVDARDLQGKNRGDLSEPQLQLLFEQQTIFVPASGNQPERWLKCDAHQLDSNWRIHYYTDITRQHRLEGEQRRMEEALREHSSTDPETGLFNRRGLLSRLEPQVSRCRRYNTRMSVVMIRLLRDQGKQPLEKGDLPAVARLIKDQARWADTLARMSEDELLMVLPETSSQGACELAERLVQQIQKLSATGLDENALGGAFGVTAWRTGDDTNTMLTRVTDAMEKARAAGGNYVAMA
ncbi:MAG TPA: sensor domain-containing diguanylate cyclase [Gammaproteobacteria bacterium]|nr:sensor domain-containing diguanylate cyclase [Gammaproteobacteria bacterium]